MIAGCLSVSPISVTCMTSYYIIWIHRTRAIARNLFEMADKAERTCPCTDPKLRQFAWASTVYPVARIGKRCSCVQLLFYFCCDVSSPPLSHDSVLKALHIDKGILTSEECSECASKGKNWYNLAAIVIAPKTTDDVQRALDVVRQQSSRGGYHLDEFAGLLPGKPTLQLLLRNKEYT